MRLLGVSHTLAAATLAFLLLSSIRQGLAAPPSRNPSSQTGTRRFTVRDSIEMSRFGRVDYEPIFSPDGRYAAVVTSRGFVRNNSIESTLWVFDTNTTKAYLHKNDARVNIAPKIVARLAATPKAIYEASYEPIISNVKWTEDSRGLLFLAQNSLGRHQLYQIELSQGKVKAATPPDKDVTQFDFAAGTIVYRVEERPDSPQPADPINPDSWDVTGLPLISILFGNSVSDFSAKYSTLWVNRKHRNKLVVDPTSAMPFRLWNYPPAMWNVLSISPDGRYVVILLPVKEVPQSWERYASAYPNLQIHSKDPDVVADSNPARLTQYAVVDLNTGRARSVVNAPNGWALGYADRNRAIWSSDGRNLLLTNTYLPFERIGDSEKTLRVRPCAAVVVSLASGTNACVSYRQMSAISSSSFGRTDNEVLLWFFRQDTPQRYRLVNGAWQQESLGRAQTRDVPAECLGPRQNGLQPLSVYVTQSLNEPPTLWATDCTTAQRSEIWNPNPQLASVNLGEASILRWKDRSGYEWTGALLMPPDHVPGQRYPLVIQAYGFEENEFLSDGEFTTAFAARPLAAAGMIVLAITERVGDQGTAQEAPEQILGFESAIDKLSGDGLIDRDRVGIIGFSRTSYYVESALIRCPEHFAAATIVDGVDESYLQYLLFFSIGTGPEAEGERIYGSAPFGTGLQVWIEKAPGFHLDRIQTPLRIEAIGPASVLAEWELYSSLWRQRKPVDFVYIPGGQHILQKPLDRMASQEGNVDWFRFWLNGEEDADRTKALQYRSWRRIREQYLANKYGRDASQ